MSLTEKLAALDRLHADATQGEWCEKVRHNGARLALYLHRGPQSDGDYLNGCGHDVEAIAALHNAYPELAAELRRLTEEVAELRKELAAVREVEESQDRGLAAIYATVEKAIGRGDWNSQMEAVEDLAGRYDDLRANVERATEVIEKVKRMYDHPTGADADWGSLLCANAIAKTAVNEFVAATPAQSLAEIKAAALRGEAESVSRSDHMGARRHGSQVRRPDRRPGHAGNAGSEGGGNR